MIDRFLSFFASPRPFVECGAFRAPSFSLCDRRMQQLVGVVFSSSTTLIEVDLNAIIVLSPNAAAL
jgi:hypothetical protein